MIVDVFTLLPEVMQAYLEASIIGKAQAADLLHVACHNIRDYTLDKHHTTDDEPYGGGGGMVMKPDPIFAAVESVIGEDQGKIPIVLLTPQGRLFSQEMALEYSKIPRVALICGRYEGVDERVRDHLVTDEISIGDYVLTGGELPALVVIDAIARQIPGVLGDALATLKDSHANGLLEHPHYTRPPVFRGWEVPEVLRSGNHALISAWRRRESLRRTHLRRPDLLDAARLSLTDQDMLADLADEESRNHAK